MSKRAGSAAKVAEVGPKGGGVPSPSVEVEEVTQDELLGVVGELNVEQKLREWAERENPESMTVRTYIYKYESATGGDVKVLCDRVDAEIPDPHSIGCQYGSGRYMMIVTIPPGGNQPQRAKGLRFRLHARYDELAKRVQSGQASASPLVAAPVASAQSSLRDGIEMVRVVVDMLKPLLEAKTSAGAVPDMGRLLEGQYDMVNSIMRKSFAQNQDLIQQVQQAQLEGPGGGDVSGSDEDEPDFLGKIMPLVEKFLPVLMGGGAGGAATAAAIRTLPEFAKVTHDTAQLSRIVAWLDKTQGKDATDQILQALKVSRPRVNGRARRGAVPAVARPVAAGA